MALSEFNLNDLYRKAFGYVAPPFPIGGAYDLRNLSPIRNPSEVFTLDASKNQKEPEGKKYSIFNDEAMLGGSFKMPVGFRIPGKEQWWKLPNEPIVSLSGSNDIEITVLNRGKKRGTVKEYLNLEDYHITIRGIAINEGDDDFPEKFFQELRDYTENGNAIEISCDFTRMHNITLCCLQKWDFPGNEQLPFRARAYEIRALSDENFELELQ
jgi:hypothetical protein